MGRKAIDETGNHYGRLTVLKRAESYQNRNKKAQWLCRCNCGNLIIVYASNLRNGNTRSCGCLHKEKGKLNLEKYNNRLPKGEAAFRGLLRAMKNGAEKRNLKWALTDEEVKDLIQNPCYYCGKLPERHLKNKRIQNQCKGDFPSNGLDRIDNSKGYSIDNVVPCCFRCNAMKEKMSISKFRDHIIKIYKYFIEKSELEKE